MWISFPDLFGGHKFSISNVAIHNLFGVDIYWYGIIIAMGFALAVILGMRNSRKFGIEQEDIIDLVLFAVPVSIILARAYYVIFQWSEFADKPLTVLNPRTGGLAIPGGIIGAFLTAYLVAKYKKIPVFKLFDFGVPYLILAQAIGRWGNFVNQEAYGGPTSLPWGMTGSRIGEVPVHPTFLYESLWNLSVFFFLIWFTKRKKLQGEVFFLYIILYGFGRFWIEGIRTDSLMLGNFRVTQVLAFVCVVVFTAAFLLRRSKAAEQQVEETPAGPSRYAGIMEKLKEEQLAEKNEAKQDEEITSPEDAGVEDTSAEERDEAPSDDKM